MVLELKGADGTMGLVFRQNAMLGRPLERALMMQEDAVQNTVM